ncbi:hypothetical protein PFISCL1PPCAC_2876 [Pristionchus fissidentatus]|uniref:Ion channel n=1 Tax=Pristionchus fissidentatus TaxID=1538716 RepID=A0AAV5UZ06_9BILA|nr:hypothetical protein PFISCL1PPCAC_2876 [Pristionchus fissidentatus]
MSQCLFARLLAAIIFVSGAVLLVLSPFFSYHRTLNNSPFRGASQPADFCENFRQKQFVAMCKHDCDAYPFVLARSCNDLRKTMNHNHSSGHLLLLTSRADCSRELAKP